MMMSWKSFNFFSKMKIFNVKTSVGFVHMGHRIFWDLKSGIPVKQRVSLPLQEALESVIKMVKYVKTQALNTRLFKELCKDINADHKVLLSTQQYHWLSKGIIINCVFFEIKLFL